MARQLWIFTVEGAKSIAYLHENPMRVIDDIKAEFHHCITGGVIGTKPLNQLIAKEDDVTIIISDMSPFLDAPGYSLPASGGISS